ncbi:MAG: type I DNA topoisomerase [Lachnospiraceae bacterium]|nr:type I DNA topoisomerase [Lachnospiraceae bacterium]
MRKYLVIVESPAKVKTIKKFLGKNYEVMASNGHVRDLPKSQLGVDVDNDFTPKYITIRGKGDILAGLRKEVKKADHVYLATDPDREGEAISWHLYEALKLDDSKASRITFNEITKSAVTASLKAQRNIDYDLVDAQQARRVLDRMVGYKISPLLWAKVKRGLSAGRVQSVTLRLICDREDEINAFIPEEYWTIEVELLVEGEKKTLTAKLTGDENGKLLIPDKKTAEEIEKALKKSEFSVLDVKKGEKVRKSPLPFTTSTLQQEASAKLNFSIQKTMRIAQQLYEGVEVKGMGTVGLITYLRTDSVRVSDEAKTSASSYIEEHYGENYVGNKNVKAASEGRIQDAHEAIRPSDIARTPVIVKESLSRDQFRLYQLIWQRFMASQMSPAVFETTSIHVGAGKYKLSTSAQKLLFEGFLSVYNESDDTDGKSSNTMIKSLDENSKLALDNIDCKQHFTQPSPHFTEASLVKTMEELGVGRPSTYSPTVSLLLGRHYIVKEGKNIFVTELGQVVNDIMKDSFPQIVDASFTANMESLLDKVEEGTVDWKMIVRNFYPDLKAAVDKAEEELEKVEIHDEVTDVICEECGRNMVIKYGPHGKFLACPGFPECRNTKPYYEKIGVECPKCGKDIVLKKTRKGRLYYGCIDNPDCDFMSWQRPVKEKCPKCGSYMVRKGKINVCANDQCGYHAKPEKEN